MKKQWIAIFMVLFLFITLISGCTDTNNGADPSLTTTVSAKNPGGKLPSKQPQTTTTAAAKTTATTAQPEETEDPTLTETRKLIADDGALFGVAYLGYAELPYWEDVCVYIEANGFSDAYPFLLEVMEDHAVLQEGGEVYAVVPVSKDVTLTVSDFLFKNDDSYIPERGEDLLTVTDGKPIVLRGNVSEIVSNLLITAENGAETIEYNPCLSGMDGTLVVDDGVCDLTNYDLVFGTYPGEPDPVFTLNTWYAQHEDAEGTTYAMTLTLDRDGTATYFYGWPYSGVLEAFEGTWSTSGDWNELTLELTGGPVDPEGNAIVDEQYETTCEFTWDLESSALVLHHEGGGVLLYGTEDAWYTFMPFDGFHLVSNWISESAYRDWCYDLNLFENGECWFIIRETEGEELVSYEGWWYLTEENTLSLSMLLHSGEHPESPELEYLYGEYLVEDWSPEGMTLRYVSGEILTLDMEENTTASFVFH